MPLSTPTYPSFTQLRTFSCTAQTLAKSTKQRLAYEHRAVPPYPYGPSQIYKQSNFGLYGTQKIRYGNKVSERNEIKTRRYWRPNVFLRRLWSESLRCFVRTRITTRTLRTVDKVGGLDEYLLGEKASRIKELGMGGWKLRWRIMQTAAVKERFRLQRERLGLLPLEDGVQVGSDGQVVSEAQVEEEIRRMDQEIADEEAIQVGEEGDMVSEGEAPFMQEEEAPARKELL